MAHRTTFYDTTSSSWELISGLTTWGAEPVWVRFQEITKRKKRRTILLVFEAAAAALPETNSLWFTASLPAINLLSIFLELWPALRGAHNFVVLQTRHLVCGEYFSGARRVWEFLWSGEKLWSSLTLLALPYFALFCSLVCLANIHVLFNCKFNAGFLLFALPFSFSISRGKISWKNKMNELREEKIENFSEKFLK